MIDSNPDGPFRYPVSDIRDQDDAPAGITPSQTVGPYVHIGLTWDGANEMVSEGDAQAVDVTFSVTDGAGDKVKDAMIEIWQSDAAGLYQSPLDPRVGEDASAEGFRGLGRGMANEDGEVTFRTLVPGAVDVNDETEAPHFKVSVFARGILERLYTRAYLPETAELAGDPVLASVPENRRDALILKREGDNAYRFDVILMHEDDALETPFFRI